MTVPNLSARIEGYFARDLNDSETASLIEMINHKGYRLLMELKAMDRQTSLEIVMNPVASKEDVMHHRIVYNCLTADLELEKTIMQIISDQQVLTNLESDNK